jgi:hypothetical protein
MLVEKLEGARRDTTLGYAHEARRAYHDLAQPLGLLGDSIAVLDAFFALHGKDKNAALDAARRVDASKNDDVEDLYLVQIALEYGGDIDQAARIRARIQTLSASPDGIGHASPIIRAFIARDHAGKGTPRFSPLHPTGKP